MLRIEIARNPRPDWCVMVLRMEMEKVAEMKRVRCWNAIELIAEAEAAGLIVSADGDRLRTRGNKEPIERMAPALRHHKQSWRHSVIRLRRRLQGPAPVCL